MSNPTSLSLGSSSNDLVIHNTGVVDIPTANISAWNSQSIGSNGYAKVGSVLIQWGTAPYNTSSSESVTFPTGFTNVFSVTIRANDRGVGSGANIAPKILTTTTTGFTYGGTGVFSSDNSTVITWMAIGN